MLNSEGLIVQFTGVLLYSLGGHEAHNSAAFKIHSIHSLSGGAWRWHINIFNIIATLFRVGAVRIWTIHHFRPNRSFAVRFVPGLTIFVRPVASRVIGPNSNRTPENLGVCRTQVRTSSAKIRPLGRTRFRHQTLRNGQEPGHSYPDAEGAADQG